MKHLLTLSCLLAMLLTMTTVFASQPPAEAAIGDAARGAALFTGSIPFAKGAAPCGACHALANRGVKGGKMAADLSGLFSPDGADAIKDSIGAIETPVMKKMYADRPLSDQEHADLAAFARQPLPDQKTVQNHSSVLYGMGATGLFLLIFVFYKRRIS